MINVGVPAAAATVPGRRRIPTPTIVPKVKASPNPSPRILRSGRGLFTQPPGAEGLFWQTIPQNAYGSRGFDRHGAGLLQALPAVHA